MTQSTMTVSAVEVSGELVLAMVEGMRGVRKRYRHLLAEYGLDDPKPDRWYSRDELLDVFETLAADAGPFVVFDMGPRVADVEKQEAYWHSHRRRRLPGAERGDPRRCQERRQVGGTTWSGFSTASRAWSIQLPTSR